MALSDGSGFRGSSFGRVRMRSGGFRNLVEGIGDGADEIFDTRSDGGGDGVKREIVFLAEGAEFFDASKVRGGVEFGRDDNHGLFGEGFAEGAELAIDDFE